MSGFTFDESMYNDFGRCEGACSVAEATMPPMFVEPEKPAVAPTVTVKELEALLPGIETTPLWFSAHTKLTALQWWTLVTRLPDYSIAPAEVTAVANTILQGFGGSASIGLLQLITGTPTFPSAALHLPVGYLKLSSSKKVPYEYVIALANTLALRETLPDDLLEHVHWAEKQLPMSKRVFVVPHNKPPPPPEDAQTRIKAIVVNLDYHPTLWRVLAAYTDFCALPMVAPVKQADVERRHLYSQMLAANVLTCQADIQMLRDEVARIDANEGAELEHMRRNWLMMEMSALK